jgi:CRP-like cAMP-binding protein
MRDAVREILARNQLFRGLPDRIIARLAGVAVRRQCKKNERVFSQGDDGQALYAIVSGRVRISAVGTAGNEVFLNIMEPNESFGEIAVIDGRHRTAGAMAMDAAELILIRRQDLLDVLHEEPELAIHLLRLFCERMRWASDMVEETALLSPPARLAKRLLSLAQLHGKLTDKGMEFRISQSELAKFLGISRQNVNEKLQVWKAEGWIAIARGRLLIMDAVSLKAIATNSVRSD